MKLAARKWTHYSNESDKQRAIEAMFDEYDRHPGNRRRTSSEAFEVYQTRRSKIGGWVLYVRIKGRKGTRKNQIGKANLERQ